MLQKYNNFLQTKIFNFDLLLALRGIMAISVVFYHFFIDKEIIKSNFAKYFLFALDGSGAVLVFFILSGYLMFKLFATEKYSIRNLKSFYITRLNRILPLYWGVLIIVGLFIYGVFWQPGNRGDFFKLFSMTQYISGKDFVLEKYRWFSVTWSLVIEMQFYLVIPFLATFLIKFKNLYVQIGLLIGFGYLAITDTVLRFGIENGVIGFLNRSILGYFPFFLVGGIVALLLAFHKDFAKYISKFTFLLPILIFGLVAIPAYTRIFNPNFNNNFIFVIFTLLIIAIYDSFAWDIKPSRWNYKTTDIFNIKKLFEIFGHLSFSIYMWHLFVIYQFGGFITASSFGFLSQFQLAVFQKSVTLVAIIIISFCSYHTLEKIKIFKNPNK